MSGRRVTLVLPWLPQDRTLHDQVLAAAWELAQASGGPSLEVLELLPQDRAGTPRACGPGLRWWSVVSPTAAEASAENCAALVARALAHPALSGQPRRLLVFPLGHESVEAVALLAEALGGDCLGRCSALALEDSKVIGQRPIFGGRLGVSVFSQADMCCAAWRPAANNLPLQPLTGSSVQRLTIEDVEAAPRYGAQAVAAGDTQRPLEGAAVVVCGGRGIGSAQGFATLAGIAESLDAALAGSLPAVDAGWVPVLRQVGISGKFVTPRLYLAVGISGTPQHMAGVASATRVIAINNDPSAPIFQTANIGVVADWAELLPRLQAHLDSPVDAPGLPSGTSTMHGPL